MLLKILIGVVVVALVAFAIYQSPLVQKHTTTSSSITSFSFSHNGETAESNYTISLQRTGDQASATVTCSPAGISVTKQVDVSLFDQLDSIVKDNQLDAWDGFNETNSEVLDGSGFSLTITYEDGSSITASGNNAFPAGFSNAFQQVRELFNTLVKQTFNLGTFSL